MAASQGPWELSIQLGHEEAAVGSLGKACQHARRKTIKVVTEIFWGADNPCGAER